MMTRAGWIQYLFWGLQAIGCDPCHPRVFHLLFRPEEIDVRKVATDPGEDPAIHKKITRDDTVQFQ